MPVARPTLRERFGGAVATGAIVAGLGYLLIVGLAGSRTVVATDALKLFSVLPAPPPPPPEPKPRPRPRSHRPNGGAARPNILSKATEVTVPPPIVVLPPPPPPVVAAPTPAAGADATSGATAKPGPGTGAGGEGNGTGSGTGGVGTGDGAGRPVVGPRQIAGRITHKDFPKDAPTTGIGGMVTTRYYVMPDGTVSNCHVVGSSGSPALDDLTCRLITERFRYAPARDAQGRPTRALFERDDEWVNEYGRKGPAADPQQGR